MTATHSYDPGEQLRVSRDSSGTLVVHHGANAMATIKQAIGGGFAPKNLEKL